MRVILPENITRKAWFTLHSQNHTTCVGLLKTALNNILLPTLFDVVNNIVQHCWASISLRSGGHSLFYNGEYYLRETFYARYRWLCVNNPIKFSFHARKDFASLWVQISSTHCKNLKKWESFNRIIHILPSVFRINSFWQGILLSWNWLVPLSFKHNK